MHEYTLSCKVTPSDRLTAGTEHNAIVINAFSAGRCFTDVIPSPAAARAFARGLLALAGEVDGGVAAEPAGQDVVKIGDFVEITEDACTSVIGKRGEVVALDLGSTLPYFVKTGPHNRMWVSGVRKVSAVIEHAPTRRALIDEARTAAGPDASPADVLAYARFLAEEERELTRGSLA
ncbi:hypothetical protein ACWCO0_09450 [Streptomyces tubercidicus]